MVGKLKTLLLCASNHYHFSLTAVKTPICSFHLPRHKVHFVFPGDKNQRDYAQWYHIREKNVSFDLCIKDKRLPGKLAFCPNCNSVSFSEPHLHPTLLKLSPSSLCILLRFTLQRLQRCKNYLTTCCTAGDDDKQT